MPSKSLIKLIDEAIIPCLLLIISKIFGILISVQILNLQYSVNYRGFLGLLPNLYFKDLSQYQIVENYSNLAMFTTAAFGLILVLIKVHFFHQSHIHPSFQAKLAKINMENIIAPTYHLYHQALIWLIFLWLIVSFLIVSALMGSSSLLLSAVSLFTALNLTWIFAIDVEKEINISKN